MVYHYCYQKCYETLQNWKKLDCTSLYPTRWFCSWFSFYVLFNKLNFKIRAKKARGDITAAIHGENIDKKHGKTSCRKYTDFTPNRPHLQVNVSSRIHIKLKLCTDISLNKYFFKMDKKIFLVLIFCWCQDFYHFFQFL